MLTPCEKNLEVWRQLWRVLERSDVVVQVCGRVWMLLLEQRMVMGWGDSRIEACLNIVLPS